MLTSLLISSVIKTLYPVLIGHSRKRFLGGDTPDDREEATVQVTQSLVGKGIWAVRVHGVKANKEVITS